MATGMLVSQIWDAESIAASSVATSAAVEIAKLSGAALHVTAITGGAGLDVTFTYSLSNSRDGTYVTPSSPATIGANIAAADVLDFAPEAAQFIKIIATNNDAGDPAVVTAQLAVQEL